MLTRICCMRLKTAGIVIGSLNAVFSLLSVAVISFGLADIDEVLKWIIDHKKTQTTLNVDSMRTAVTAIFATLLVFCVAQTITSILLVIGSVKGRHRLLVPWLLLCAFSMVALALYYFYLVVITLISGAAFGYVVILFVKGSISLAFQIFYWFAIYSLYKEIQAQRKSEAASEGSAYSKF